MVNICGWTRSKKDCVSSLWATVRCQPHFATHCAARDTDTLQRTCHVYSTLKKKRENEIEKEHTEALFSFGRQHIRHVPRHLAVRRTSLPLSSIILITSMGKCLIHGDHSALPGSNLLLAHSTSPWTQFHLFIFNPPTLCAPPSRPTESCSGKQPWNWKECFKNVSVHLEPRFQGVLFRSIFFHSRPINNCSKTIKTIASLKKKKKRKRRKNKKIYFLRLCGLLRKFLLNVFAAKWRSTLKKKKPS